MSAAAVGRGPRPTPRRAIRSLIGIALRPAESTSPKADDMIAPAITAEDLADLEAEVVSALHRRDNSGLSILGFGEISVALGHPSRDPVRVCKRTPPFTVAQFEQYRQLVDRYVADLRDVGLAVVETGVMSVPRSDKLVAYLVQPLLPAETLGHRVLAGSEPDPEHPFLTAVAASLELVSDRLSVDAQVTNWSWDGTRLTLLDVGTPFLWDGSGRFLFDMDPYLPMISAPLRGTTKNELTKMVERWREPRGVALDVVANLYREGLEQWTAPAAAALNAVLGDGRSITVNQARAVYDEDLKTWPRLTRLKRLERAWQTKVRRRHYDFFIQTTFAGDVTF